MVPANSSPDDAPYLTSVSWELDHERRRAPVCGAPIDGSVGTAAGKDPIYMAARLVDTNPEHGAGRRAPAAAEPRAASEQRA